MRIPERRPWLWIAGLAALVAHGCFGCEREIVTQPALDVVVRDAGGPIEGAKVTWFWWSDPHDRFEGSGSAIANAEGAASFEKQVGTERVMPLCMHGVPAHGMNVCVESAGHRSVVFWIGDLGAQTDATVTLPPGESVPCSFESVSRGSRTTIDAVEGTNVRASVELVPPNDDGPEADAVRPVIR